MNTPNLIRPLVLSLSLGMALSILLVAAASGNSRHGSPGDLT